MYSRSRGIITVIFFCTRPNNKLNLICGTGEWILTWEQKGGWIIWSNIKLPDYLKGSFLVLPFFLLLDNQQIIGILISNYALIWKDNKKSTSIVSKKRKKNKIKILPSHRSYQILRGDEVRFFLVLIIDASCSKSIKISLSL